MNCCNKICTCLCCTTNACNLAICIDTWQATQAIGLAQVECGHCCWRICAPICHTCELGSCSEGMPFCWKGTKYCMYSLALNFVWPCDGIYGCIKYDIDVCSGPGVKGFGDMLKHTSWLNHKIRDCCGLTNGSEPYKSYGEYRI